MEPKIIRKNILDLSYKRNLQLMNIILIIGGGSLLASFTGLILNFEQAFKYMVIFFIVGMICYIFYNSFDERLERISAEIAKLADK